MRRQRKRDMVSDGVWRACCVTMRAGRCRSPRWDTLGEEVGRAGRVCCSCGTDPWGGEGPVDLGVRRVTWGTAKDLSIAGEQMAVEPVE